MPSVCYHWAMSKGLRRRHYHVYLDHVMQVTFQDRQKAWREVARLSDRHPDTAGWNVLRCEGRCRVYLRGIAVTI